MAQDLLAAPETVNMYRQQILDSSFGVIPDPVDEMRVDYATVFYAT